MLIRMISSVVGYADEDAGESRDLQDYVSVVKSERYCSGHAIVEETGRVQGDKVLACGFALG